MTARPHIVSTKLLQPQTKALLPGWVGFTEVAAIAQEAALGEVLTQRLTHLKAIQSLFIFSSAFAVQVVHAAFAAWPFNWRVAFVGHKTQAAFQKLYSQGDLVATANSALELACILKERQEPCNVVYCCSNRHLHHLPQQLRNASFMVTELVVYNTLLQPVHLSSTPDAILFFSPSAVESFVSQHSILPSTLCVANGSTTAGALAQHARPSQVVVSDIPAQASVLAACINALQIRNQQQPTTIDGNN